MRDLRDMTVQIESFGVSPAAVLKGPIYNMWSGSTVFCDLSLDLNGLAWELSAAVVWRGNTDV